MTIIPSALEISETPYCSKTIASRVGVIDVIGQRHSVLKVTEAMLIQAAKE
jgi:hypothetical protein